MVFGNYVPETTLPVEFHFGPNPVIANSPDAHITFSAEQISTEERRVRLEVTIFNSAGEKIIKLSPTTDYEFFNQTDRVYLEWYLDNKTGTKIAPGVYMALLELSFADGSPSVTSKAKLAVIR